MRIIDRSVWVLLIVSVGCSPEIYRAETRLFPDGKSERVICQPANATSVEIREDSRWETRHFVSRDAVQQGAFTPIRRLPRLTDAADGAKKKTNYFVAWGRAGSPEALPDHFVLAAEEIDRSGRLNRSYRRADLGLLVEHRWQETLADIVELGDLRQARKELTTLLTGMLFETLKRHYHVRYDFSRFDHWLTSTLKSCVANLFDLDFQSAIEKRRPGTVDWNSRVIRVLARHGLRVAGANGQLLETFPKNVRETTYAPFARKILRQTVRDPRGQPPPAAVIREILVWLTLEETADSEESPLEREWKKVVVARFGSEKAFEAQGATLMRRIFGVYRAMPFFGLFAQPREFRYVLQVPGTVIKTNGFLEADDRVQWKFNAEEAYPFGYVMSCRSVEFPAKARKLLPDAKRLESRLSRLRFLELAGEPDKPLARALRACLSDGSWKPLEAYGETLNTEEGKADRARLKRLYRLLDLP